MKKEFYQKPDMLCSLIFVGAVLGCTALGLFISILSELENNVLLVMFCSSLFTLALIFLGGCFVGRNPLISKVAFSKKGILVKAFRKIIREFTWEEVCDINFRHRTRTRCIAVESFDGEEIWMDRWLNGKIKLKAMAELCTNDVLKEKLKRLSANKNG